MNRLSLSKASRELGEGRAPRRFLDFEVDGASVLPQLRARGFDLISGLWLDEPGLAGPSQESVMRLLGELPTDAPHDRVTLYVCPECADPGCGAVTIRIDRTKEAVSWRAWGYQDNYEDEVGTEDFADLAEFTFSRDEYDRVLRQALDRLAAH